MKRGVLFILIVACFPVLVSGQKSGYRFDHGPYLQGLKYNEVTVYFSTSKRGFSRVEVREKADDEPRVHVTVRDGLIEAYNTLNSIKVDGLKPATRYEYRLVSSEINRFRPYNVVFGKHIASEWYSFETPDPDATDHLFVAMSDIHDDERKYEALLSYMPVGTAQSVFLIGDIMSSYEKSDQPYDSFIDASVESFATRIPFVVVRGNHETRGRLARQYENYVMKPFYGLHRIGDVAIVMLDSGEDKPDSHSVYAGLTAFDDYRAEQAAWLAGIVETDEYKRARHKIVMIHIPPMIAEASSNKSEDYASQKVYELYMPVLNRAEVDLMICGHTHNQMLLEKVAGIYEFPVVINDNKSASAITVSQDGIHVKTVDWNGVVTLDRTF